MNDLKGLPVEPIDDMVLNDGEPLFPFGQQNTRDINGILYTNGVEYTPAEAFTKVLDIYEHWRSCSLTFKTQQGIYVVIRDAVYALDQRAYLAIRNFFKRT